MQQASSNIIWLARTNSWIHYFLPECIAFNQNALRSVGMKIWLNTFVIWINQSAFGHGCFGVHMWIFPGNILFIPHMSQHFLVTDCYKLELMSNVFIIDSWQGLIARLSIFFSKIFNSKIWMHSNSRGVRFQKEICIHHHFSISLVLWRLLSKKNLQSLH